MTEQIKAIILSFPYEFWPFFGSLLILTYLIFWHSRQLFLAGLGALTLAVFLNYEFIEINDFFTQFVAFASLTILWSLAMVLPFAFKDYWTARYRYLKGEYCIIISHDLKKGKKGIAKIHELYMPVIMQSDSGVHIIPKGERAKIINTKGKLLIVEPTSVPLPTQEELQTYRRHIQKNPLIVMK